MYISDGEAWAIASHIGNLDPLADAASKRPSAAEPVSWTLPGFVGSARVLTSFGLLPIEALRVNDPVRTTTGRNLQVRKIHRIGLDRAFLERHPAAHPVQIAANAFAKGLPERDMLVSPGQELTIERNGMPPQRLRAGEIAGSSAVVRAPRATLIYYSFDLTAAAHVYVEGLPVLIPATAPSRRDKDDEEE